MADVQLENGFTRIANALLDAYLLARFNGAQMSIVGAVIRRTFGWQRKECDLTNAELREITGLGKSTISQELNTLVSEGVVIQLAAPTFGSGGRYRMQKDPTKWGRFACSPPSLDVGAEGSQSQTSSQSQTGSQSQTTGTESRVRNREQTHDHGREGSQERTKQFAIANPTGSQVVGGGEDTGGLKKGKKEKETPVADAVATKDLPAPRENGSDDGGEEGLSVDDRPEARQQMQEDAREVARRIPKGERRAFNAEVRMLVTGDDMTAWRHPETGEQIAWHERPRLLRTAYANLEAGKRPDLRRALTLALQEQLDPFPVRRSNAPKPGSPAAKILEHASDAAARKAAHRVDEVEVSRGREEAERWAKQHPAEAEAIRRDVYGGVDDEAALTPWERITLDAAIRSRIRAQIEKESAA